jgi:signal transduction histidine kinase
MRAEWKSILLRYGIAVVAVLVAFGVRMMLSPVVGASVSPLFYLAVMIGAWYGGMGPGLLSTVLAGFITAWRIIPPPNSFRMTGAELMQLFVFLAEAVLIGSLAANRRRAELTLRQVRDELEERVRERTTDLEARSAELQASNLEMHRQAAERREMQQAILEISEREQQRIGHDLHDGLGQELTGVAFLSKALAEGLASEGRRESQAALEVVGLVNHAIGQARELARGLCPTELDTEGLGTALRQLALRAEALFGVECKVEAGPAPCIRDKASEKHLYRIAQEAINNAVKHGHARRLQLGLKERKGLSIMTVSDDGAGFVPPPAGHKGMGLQLMNYRAGMIGGQLELRRLGKRGTLVKCSWPSPSTGSTDSPVSSPPTSLLPARSPQLRAGQAVRRPLQSEGKSNAAATIA